jgi:hypothetical protein
MINIYDKTLILDHFDKHPNEPITLYVPGSGSWCETFYNKEQYIKRMKAWENHSPEWYNLRGDVTYPWINTL